MAYSVVHIRLLILGLLTFSLVSCAPKKVVYPPPPLEMVWFLQDTEDEAMSADLDLCRSSQEDQITTEGCMQAKGYLLISQSEAELLKVRWLQEESLDVDEIAERLKWNKDKVLVYMDEEYELPHAESLARQPLEILTSIGKPAVKPLIASLEEDDPLVKRNAVEALGIIRDPRAVEPLTVILSDPDPFIRRHAVQALGKIKDSRAVDALVAVLTTREELSHVRSSAAESLGKIGEPSAVEPLVSALTDRHWDVRSQAAQSLGKIRDPQAVDALIGALQDEDATVRGYAAMALGEIGDGRAVGPLIAALEDKSINVRRSVATALKRITGEDFGGAR